MDRITARMDDGTAFVCSETGSEGVGHFTTQRRLPELIARLAEYEDTGLTPEEIRDLQAELKEETSRRYQAECNYDHWREQGLKQQKKIEILRAKLDKAIEDIYNSANDPYHCGICRKQHVKCTTRPDGSCEFDYCGLEDKGCL